MPKTITVTLPKPHYAQAQVIAEASRFNVVDCGRRFGKTTMGIDRAADPTVLAYPVGWFSPTYKMLSEVWRECVRVFEPITVRRSSQEHRLEFITGGLLEFWSLENPNVARGRKYKRVVVDEAAMIPALLDVFQHVMRPALADFIGDAWFLSTPKGYNDFKTMYDWGQDPERPDWKSWQLPTSANPFIADSEIEAMRQELPERTFNQEVLAIFNDNENAVFRNIRACMYAGLEPSYDDHPRHRIVAGVDWGKQSDYTAISVGCATCKQELAHDRFRQIDYHFQYGRLKVLIDQWRVTGVLPERNSVGEPAIEHMARAGVPLLAGHDGELGFNTLATTKPPLIENLALAFERAEWQFQSDPVWTAELEAYERKVSTITGRSQYSAPEGMHDDTVMARALMLWAAGNSAPLPERQPEQVNRWAKFNNAPAQDSGRWRGRF